MARERSLDVSLYPFRKIEPGRKTDFQTSVSRTLSSSSSGEGGFSFNPVSFPSSSTCFRLLLGHGDGAHRAGAGLALVRQSRIVQAIAGAPFHAHRAPGAGVVVHHEDGERLPHLGVHGL